MAPVIRTIIADDEVLAREKLRILLSAEPGIQIIAECRSGKETVSALQAHRPDLLLLDIQMPDSDGFEVLKSIPSEEMPIVVFTTAYDQYAIKAFEAHALDYLLKPFDQERLQDLTLNRVGGHEVEDIHISLLANTMDATHALLQTHGIPG